MIYFRCLHSPLIWNLILLASIATPATARAQEEPDQAAEMNEPEPRQETWTVEQFHQWVDQTVFDSNTAVACRGRLNMLLELKLDNLRRTCGMTAAQGKKLQLAGRGDIKRFFDRFDEIKRSFPLVKDDPAALAQTQSELLELRGSLRTRLFDDGSLFSKMLQTTLNSEQAAKYTIALRQSKLFRHRTKVDEAVEHFDVIVGFSDEQRRRFTKLLLEQTRRVKKSGPSMPDAHIVMIQAARLPEATMRPMFDDAQWRVLGELRKLINDNMKLNGVVLDAEVAEAGRITTAGSVPGPKTKAEQKDR